MAIKLYTKQFSQLLPLVFKTKSYFTQAFGSLDVLDGVTNNAKAFTVKTSDMEVVVNDYDGEKAIDGGRLGAMKEVVATDVDVDYTATKAINEGVDTAKVNDDLNQVVAERQEKQAAAIAKLIDSSLGTALSKNAGKTLELKEVKTEAITALFNAASKEFTNNEVNSDVTRLAYVTSDIYNELVDSDLAKTDKNAQVNVGDNALYKFKGFVLIETPDNRFATGEVAYFTAVGIGKSFAGFNEYRALDEVPDFFGVALQSLVKYGSYIPVPNKKAIVKATLTVTP